MKSAQTQAVSTHAVPARQREAYWRDLICNTFVELDCQRTGEGFFGELEAHQMGELALTRVRSSQQEVERGPQQIAKSTEPYFLASLQISGQCMVEQDGRRAHLKPGDIALYDTTRQYRLKFCSQFEELVVRLPRAMVADRLSSPERITATCVSGKSAMGRLAFNFVSSVAQEADQLTSQDRERLAGSVLELLSNAIATGTAADHKGSRSSAALLLRAKLYITQHLQNAKLDRAEVADQLGISSRYLSKLFATEELCFSQWLREQRLRRIADDLSRPELTARSVSAVAYSWGMSSMPHFSRVFRDRFGCTPGQHRTAAAGK